MAKQIQHDPEALLAWDFPQVESAPRGNFSVALRKSSVENVKVRLPKKFGVFCMNDGGCGPDYPSIDPMGRQFRPVDVNDCIERIKNERVIMHGSNIRSGGFF